MINLAEKIARRILHNYRLFQDGEISREEMVLRTHQEIGAARELGLLPKVREIVNGDMEDK